LTARRLPNGKIRVLHALRGAPDNAEMVSFNHRLTCWAWEIDANKGRTAVPLKCCLVALACRPRSGDLDSSALAADTPTACL